MKKIISYLSIYIVLHGMYFIQGCCSKPICLSLNSIDAFYHNNIGDTLLAGDTAVYNSLEIVVTPQVYEANCMNNNTWISSAYATTCSPEYYAMTSLKEIKITATENYSVAYPSGSVLNNIFDIQKSKESYLGGLPTPQIIRFNTPPDNDMMLNLKVEFYYEHFDFPFEAQLPTIYLQK